MIRSLAALFAKKTAIVAIAGVTVIGGATFALAEVVPTDEPSAEEEVSTEEETSTEEKTPTEEETSTEEDEDEAAGEKSEEHEGAEEDDESSDDAELRTTLDTEVVDDEVAKDNHGATVSAAAKGGAPCDDLEGNGFKNHGQCVASVASGKKVPAEPTEPLTQDPLVTGPETTVEPFSEDTVETQVVVAAEEPSKGKGNVGGNGKGKRAKG
jgi:hypothetical protein